MVRDNGSQYQQSPRTRNRSEKEGKQHRNEALAGV